MNKKGFILTETLIVSAVVLTTLVLIYSQFSRINKNYGDSFSYDNISDIYTLKQVSSYLEDENVGNMYNDLNTYLNITDCNLSYYSNKNYCSNLMNISNIKYLLFTYNKKVAVYGEISKNNPFDLGMQNYLKTIDDSDTTYSYRIVAEFNDGTYASIPFGHNKYKDAVLNGANPIFEDGLIPVSIADDGTVTIADQYSSWYDYTNKMWANAVIVNKTSRSKYLKAAAGTTITQSDILGYFVWVPRYRYQLFNAAGADGTTAKEIKIEFENKFADKSSGTKDDDWLTEPAFTFGTDELNGIWVGKFETTGDATTPTVLPNLVPLKSQKISEEFASSQLLNDMNKYGINMDSHMAKNSEWGAIAYLSQSKYGRCTDGKCTEISINNSSNFLSGTSAGKPGDATTTSSTSYAYNTNEGVLATTTGNITGIYDMSGGSWEYVMGVLVDSNGNKYTGKDAADNSGFNGIYAGGSITNGIDFPDSKYYDTYTADQNILGRAMLETRGWYGDFKDYPNTSAPWFTRGGSTNNNAGSGIFDYYSRIGNALGYVSFRTILAQ